MATIAAKQRQGLSSAQDEPCFHDLYQSHNERVRRILARLVPQQDLDDLVQETFVKIYLKQDSFKGESSIDTWIYRITANTAMDHLRKKKQWTNLISRFLLQPEKKKDPSLDRKILAQEVLEQLPVAERLVIVLYYLEEYQQDEISKILQIPLGTVKSRLHNAKKRLKTNLEELR